MHQCFHLIRGCSHKGDNFYYLSGISSLAIRNTRSMPLGQDWQHWYGVGHDFTAVPLVRGHSKNHKRSEHRMMCSCVVEHHGIVEPSEARKDLIECGINDSLSCCMTPVAKSLRALVESVKVHDVVCL